MLDYKTYLKIRKQIPLLMVDAVIIQDGKVLLTKRNIPPYKGWWCLPGGHLDYGETCEKGIIREVEEETGFKTRVVKLIGVYSDPKRDPRGHFVSATYLLKIIGGKTKQNKEVKETKFFSLKELPQKIVPDHRNAIRDAIKLIR